MTAQSATTPERNLFKTVHWIYFQCPTCGRTNTSVRYVGRGKDRIFTCGRCGQPARMLWTTGRAISGGLVSASFAILFMVGLEVAMNPTKEFSTFFDSNSIASVVWLALIGFIAVYATRPIVFRLFARWLSAQK